MPRATLLCASVFLLMLVSSLRAAENDPAHGKKLLIVAPASFRASLAAFVRFKQQSLPTELVSLEKILKTSPGIDDPERLKAPPPPPAPYQKGRFNPSGLGEQLLRRPRSGAVAYIGCNTGSQPCALTLVEGFIHDLKKPGSHRLGDCWASAVRYYYDKERLAKLVPTESWYPASIFFQGMKFMLFGDPSLPLVTAGNPARER